MNTTTRALCAVLIPSMSALPVLQAQPLSAGKWLNDLGRNYPLSRQAEVSEVDAEITLLLLDAATRVEPDLAEAYWWKYDMLAALDRWEPARQALTQYIRLQPNHLEARLAWLELASEEFQTAEDRAAFFRSRLQRAGSAPGLRSALHMQLAEYHLNRGEMDEAADQARLALRDDPFNLSARALLQDLDDQEPGVLEQVRYLLHVLRASPASQEAAFDLGQELEWQGWPAEADRWYRHVEGLQKLMPPGEVEIPVLIARCRVLTDMDRLDEAEALARQALEQHDTLSAGYLLLARIERRRGRADQAAEHVARARQAIDSLLTESRETMEPSLLGEVAWFMVHQDDQADTAARLARAVLADDPDSIAARRALGAALLAKGEPDQARTTLEPIADRDAWASILLARTLKALGEDPAATRRLLSVATRPAPGEVREQMLGLIAEWDIAPPTTRPALPEIRQELDAFPQQVLDYPHHPEKYLQFTLKMVDTRLTPTDPWRCTFRLKNVGAFPIVLGPEYMVTPDVLCAIETRGDQMRTSGPMIRVEIPHGKTLAPGETLEHVQTVDLGNIRGSMIGTPQVTHDVVLQGILSPMRFLTEDGQDIWAPGVGGLASEPVEFRRDGYVGRPEEVRRLITQARSNELNERIEATELLAMLLAEAQHLAAGRLHYAVPRIQVASVRDAVLGRALDDDWRVRARVAEAMRWFALDDACNKTAARLLSDPHWCVRGLILRTLADHHRTSFKSVLANRADAETHDWARQMAKALLERVERDRTARAEPTRPDVRRDDAPDTARNVPPEATGDAP